MTVVAVDDPGAVDIAVAALRSGHPVVLPTETVYGVAVLAADLVATTRLAELKARSANQALAVLVSDVEQGLELAAEPTEAARALAERWWPGPLTLVVARAPTAAHLDLGGDQATIGIRCPDEAFARAVAARVGPIATTSANRHGDPTPATARGAADALAGTVAVVVDGGPRRGVPSTVVGLTAEGMIVLRRGAIDPADL